MTYTSRNALTGIYCFLGIQIGSGKDICPNRRNALTGICCFLGVDDPPQYSDGGLIGRNALTGIYYFRGALRH